VLYDTKLKECGPAAFPLFFLILGGVRSPPVVQCFYALIPPRDHQITFSLLRIRKSFSQVCFWLPPVFMKAPAQDPSFPTLRPDIFPCPVFFRRWFFRPRPSRVFCLFFFSVSFFLSLMVLSVSGFGGVFFFPRITVFFLFSCCWFMRRPLCPLLAPLFFDVFLPCRTLFTFNTPFWMTVFH